LEHLAGSLKHELAMITFFTKQGAVALRRRSAFTLVELLVVIAIVALLAALLLPVLAKAKAKGQAAFCLNNLKQMQLAWLSYTDDHQEVMPLNWVDLQGNDLPGSWVLGNAGTQADLANLTNGTLFAYVGSVRTYHCPTDPAKTTGQVAVTRSYATQVLLHTEGILSTFVWPAPYLQYADCVKLSAIHLPSPSEVWTFIEPSAAGHDYGSWDFIVTQLSQKWAHQPTDRHSSGSNLSFVDGHAEVYRWRTVHEWRGSAPEKIQDGSDLEDYQRLLAGVPRTH
jgi:prepilin-type N-terminal cleavage/methylation domain-containing protein/prepilin-type processing-associated H-X9-DG protein